MERAFADALSVLRVSVRRSDMRFDGSLRLSFWSLASRRASGVDAPPRGFSPSTVHGRVPYGCSISEGIPRAVPDIDPELVRAALGGDATAVRVLVQAMIPIVNARVARALLRRSEGRGRDIQVEVADFAQEVFVGLFSDDCKALRAWDPARGLSFSNFVGLLAQHRAASLLRSRRGFPWATESLHDAEPNAPSVRHQPMIEAGVASRELLARLLEQLEAELSPRGMDLFHRLYVDEQCVDEVCAQTGLRPNAVHQWRRRLGLAARRALEALLSEGRAGTEQSSRVVAQQSPTYRSAK